MKIQRGFKFRLKSLGQESNAFWQQAGACRFVWNFFLKRQEYRRSRGHYVESFQTMCSQLTQLKKEYTWLKSVDSTVLQQSLKDLYRAYQDGFDKNQPNKRLPKLKKKHKSRPSFRYTQRVNIDHGNRVYLPKLGTFGFHRSRDIIGKLKNTTVGYDSGHWYVSFQTEYTRTERPHNSNTIVGIDLGVNRHTTLSSGFYVDGFKLIKGGRFYHVIGLFDKGQAIDASRDFFAKKYPNKQVVTIGLGDSPNDLPMLETVDIAIVIKSGRSAEMKLNNTRAIFSTKEGPAGWNEEILKLLEAESSET